MKVEVEFECVKCGYFNKIENYSEKIKSIRLQENKPFRFGVWCMKCNAYKKIYQIF